MKDDNNTYKSAKMNKKQLIAIVGVSHDLEKYGSRIFRDLVQSGYRVVGVNPKGGEVAGQKLFKNLDEISPKPDLVITVVPPAITEKVVEQCQKLGISQMWMQPGSESERAIELAKNAGITLTANACYMKQEQIW